MKTCAYALPVSIAMPARTGFRLMPWAKWRVGFDGLTGSDEVMGPYFRRIVPGEEDMLG
jgi:hypothetical protein